jgi:hypothetical protein
MVTANTATVAPPVSLPNPTGHNGWRNVLAAVRSSIRRSAQSGGGPDWAVLAQIERIRTAAMFPTSAWAEMLLRR